jgi:chromosome segregation ATPase
MLIIKYVINSTLNINVFLRLFFNIKDWNMQLSLTQPIVGIPVLNKPVITQTVLHTCIVKTMQDGDLANSKKSGIIKALLNLAFEQMEADKQEIVLQKTYTDILEKQNKEIGQSVGLLVARRLAQDKKVEQLSIEQESLKARKEEIFLEAAKLREDFSDLNKEKAELTLKLDAIEKKHTELEEKSQVLETKIAQLEKESKNLLESYKGLIIELDFLKSEKLNLLGKEALIKKSVIDLQVTMDALKQEREMLFRDNKQLKGDYEKLMSLFTDRTKHYQETKSALEELRSEARREAYLKEKHEYKWLSNLAIASGGCLMAAATGTSIGAIILSGVATERFTVYLNTQIKDLDRRNLKLVEKTYRDKHPNASALEALEHAKRVGRKERAKEMESNPVSLLISFIDKYRNDSKKS